MQTRVAPRCGRDHGRRELRLLRDAHRDVAFTQRIEHVVVEPASMAKLDGVAAARRQRVEKDAEPVEILLEVGRKLKQDRSQPIAEGRRGLQQEFNGARAFRLEPRVVRDALARLDGEDEGRRHLSRPLEQHMLPGQPVEGVVDLHRRELARIQSEHRVVLAVARIE